MFIPRNRLGVIIVVLLLVSTDVIVAHPGLHHDIQQATERLVASPDRAELLLQRGRLYRLDGQFPMALVDLDRAAILAPDDRHIALEHGMTLSALGRDNEAEAELRRSIQSGGSSSIAHAELGRVLSRKGRTEPAIAEYSRALVIQPDVDIYIERALLQESIGDLDDAATGLADGMKLLGGAVVLRDALIRVETARGRFDAAIALIDQVLDDAGVKTDWYLRRGDVWKCAGNMRAAYDEYERALGEANRVLARRNAAIFLYSRARVYVAMERRGEAVQDLQAALAKSPRFHDASVLLNQLQPKSSDNQGVSDDHE